MGEIARLDKQTYKVLLYAKCKNTRQMYEQRARVIRWKRQCSLKCSNTHVTAQGNC